MKTSKTFLFISSLFLAVSCFAGNLKKQVVATAEKEAPTITERTWTATGEANKYVVDETNGVIIGKDNGYLRGNYFLTEDNAAMGDYKITIKAQGTMSWPNDKIVHVGIIPWYMDASNYLIAYIDWDVNERKTGIRQCQLTGRINGTQFYTWKSGSFVKGEWNDIWMDGDNAQYALQESDEFYFSVSKTLAPDRDADIFTFYLGKSLSQMNELGFIPVRDTLKYSHMHSKTGIYAYNDTVTFKEYDLVNLNNTTVFSDITEGNVAKSNGESWKYSDGAYSVDVRGSEKPFDTMIVTENDNINDGYEISSEINVTGNGDNFFAGLLSYYKDEYTYVGAGIKASAGKVKVGFLGQYSTSEEKVVEEEIIDEFDDVELNLSDITKISVKKSGMVFELYLNDDISPIKVYTNENFIKGGYVGYYVADGKVSFTELTNEVATYTSYDWFIKSMHGRTYYVSANSNDDDAVVDQNGAFKFNTKSLDTTDETKYSKAYYQTSLLGYVDLTVSAGDGITSGGAWGVYVWLENDDNYYRVIVTETGIIAEYSFGEKRAKETYPHPETFSYETTGKRYLKVTLKNGISTIKYGETVASAATITETFTVDGYNIDYAPKIGYLAAKHAVAIKTISATGFTPYTVIEKDGWKFYGSRPDSWNLVDDNTLQAYRKGGCSFLRDLALKPNPDKKNFYMGSKVKITNLDTAETKVALVPYYVNASNYIMVMLSKWASAPNPTLIITGKVNGTFIGGGEWHEYQISYDFANATNNVEVGIQDDRVLIYLNGSPTPQVNASLSGVSTRSLTGQQTGFYFFNCDCLFDDFVLCSDTRTYQFTEKPVISIILGKKVTEGFVGDVISTPTLAASNSLGETLDVVISLTDPDGEEVTLSKNKFAAEKVGTYHFKATCTDTWGNKTDPFEYDIVISEKPVEPDPEPQPKKGCAGSIVATSSLVTIVSLLGISLLAIKKKELK